MAHFARLGTGNKVLAVHRVHNDIATTEQAGIDFLNKLHKLNATWRQTSYNTKGGVHSLGGTPFRKNYAGIGYKYDSTRDAFIPPKRYQSWTLNEDTCHWDPPVALPDDAGDSGKSYRWNEETKIWNLIT